MNIARIARRIGAGAALAGCLAGCATTARLLGQTQQVGPVGLLEERTAFILTTVCQTPQIGHYAVDPGSGKPLTKGTGRYRKGVLLAGCAVVRSFYGLVNLSDQDMSPEQARLMLEQGILLSDAACANWFEQLDGARRASGTAAGMTSGVTSLTNVVQGQTGVEAPAIAIVAAVGRTVTEGFSTFNSNYMLSPSLPDVSEAVRAYRQQVAETYLARADVGTKVRALRYLQYYERTCSSLGVQQFLNQAIQKAGEQQVSGAAALPLAVDAALKATAQDVGFEIGAQDVLGEGDLVYLALLWETMPEMKKAYEAPDPDQIAAEAKAVAAEEKAKAAGATEATRNEATEARKLATAAAATSKARKEAAKAAYDKVAKLLPAASRNRVVTINLPQAKLFDLAVTKTGDTFAPTKNGAVGKRKLEESFVFARLKGAADQLYKDMQAMEDKPKAGG